MAAHCVRAQAMRAAVDAPWLRHARAQCPPQQFPSSGDVALPANLGPEVHSCQGMAAAPAKRCRISGKTRVLSRMPGLGDCVIDPGVVATMMRGLVLGPEHVAAAGLSVEEPKTSRKKVYLVTLPHPKVSALTGLEEPGKYDRAQIITLMLQAFANPIYGASDIANQSRASGGVLIDRLCVFQERHATGHVHYHVAVSAANSFRFVPYKRALLQRCGLASHWSSHDGYWSCVRYGYLPSPKKPEASLDKAYAMWQREGQHPPLAELSQEPNTAAALRARREASVRCLAAKGKAMPRATEMDIYGLIVEQGFRNTHDDRSAHMRLALYCKQHCSPEIYRFAFQNRHKLPGLIDDVWAWETLEEDIATSSLSRVQRLRAAAQKPCACGGLWRRVAETAILQNGFETADFAEHVYLLLRDGRREDRKTVVLVGKYGGEGKSFLLAPLRTIFGDDVFEPCKDNTATRFPLLGLETKKVVLLDEWSFMADHGLSLNTQLLWMEGKPLPILRPQNSACYHGHLLYKGTAPVLITCKDQEMGPIVTAAELAVRSGTPTDATMVLRRMRRYHLTVPLPVPDGTHVPECGSCFAALILQNSKSASNGF